MNTPQVTEASLAMDVAHYRKLARGNYFTTYFLYIIAILASILSTILAAINYSGIYLAITTAIPALVLLISNTFKFPERAQWHYEKKRRLDSLLRRRQAGAAGTSPPEMADEWNKIDEEMDKTWPGWGVLPGVPHQARDV